MVDVAYIRLGRIFSQSSGERRNYGPTPSAHFFVGLPSSDDSDSDDDSSNALPKDEAG